MKKLYPLLIISILIYWGCEEEIEEDTTPPTGSTPPEIGNLANLQGLNLHSNQLSGLIPDEICNQGASLPSLSNNKLCPPYPSCVEDYVGAQDTSSCDTTLSYHY